ncbi:MAG TPA: 23S rRNA (pseudouridine(1915)-N(3))-methyltransferase RlmH [Bacteroidales bacterium]|jgi:23S rRNA (pseudouridine1915-N3)-methyltransferase|nr:23S rRNA (pseudouridine(1915)-N(3))-methyltransferase RlmH [Bacteroidales bacterium]HRS19147.1 23S rRNA (pseudouridine(1915)-N(3))-methyltransferase RlmH [Bacteroidales bacterium]
MLKITLLVVGKTTDEYLKQGIQVYMERLRHFCNFSIIEIPELQVTSKVSHTEIKKKEGDIIMSKIPRNARVFLLDEQGKQYASRQFATLVDNAMQTSVKELFFVVGGAFGFSDEVYARYSSKISFSAMTFSHQMIRLFFVEQIYRAFSIINGLPYHHD